MLQKIATLGVKRTLLLSIAVALAVAGTRHRRSLVNREVRKALERRDAPARRVGRARPRGGARPSALAERRDDEVAAGGGATAGTSASFSYVIVLRADSTVAAKRLARGYRGTAEEAISAHTSRGHGRRASATATTSPSRGRSPRRGSAAGGREERTVGYVLLGALRRGAAGADRRGPQRRSSACSPSAALLLAALVYVFVSQLLLRPLDAMSAVARRVSDCDLTARARRSSATTSSARSPSRSTASARTSPSRSRASRT